MYIWETRGIDSGVILSVLFLAAVALLAYIINTVLPFVRRRSYDDEKYFWKEELRRHYISYIPIIGRFIYKRHR